jgi:hypothetical protein
MSLDFPMKDGPGWHVLVLADVALCVAATWLRNITLTFAVIIGRGAVLNVWFIRLTWRARAYLVALRAKIEAAHSNLVRASAAQ